MTWEQAAVWVGAVGGLIGGVGGGLVMPLILHRLHEGRGDRLRAFARVEGLLTHLDECLESKAESLRNQINGVHLEVAREYAPRQELRDLAIELRGEIELGRRMLMLEDAFKKK